MRALRIIFAVVIPLFNISAIFGQHTVGLTQYDAGNADGYVLFSPMVSTQTFLIDKCGEKVHEWNTSARKPALAAYLLEDGSLLRTGQLNNVFFNAGGNGGLIEKFDWDGNLLWGYSISDSTQCMHHDIAALPNGNILCIVWDRRAKQEAILMGKDTSYTNTHLWSEKIIELQPISTDSAAVVWEWKLWDHLVQDFDNTKMNFGVVSSHPELVNINYFPGAANTPDWIHVNSIDYHPGLDQIVLSSHTFSEIWIIDHSTTTAQASTHTGGNSGKGGDLLYRWGNPQAYQRGNPSTKVFFGQHHATWVPQGYPNEGKIVVFNNGLNRPGTYSSLDMMAPPLNVSNTYDVPATTAFLPTGLFWNYTDTPPSDFYSSNISGVYPMRNGSFMVTNGTKGMFFEIDSAGNTIWNYISPVTNSGIASQGSSPTNNLVFRCNFYESNYPGLAGQMLIPLGEIELNPIVPSICESLTGSYEQITTASSISLYPNPFSDQLILQSSSIEDLTVSIYNFLGQEVMQQTFTNTSTLNSWQLASGIYFYTVRNHQGTIKVGKIVKE